jgi:hypothetical protein
MPEKDGALPANTSFESYTQETQMLLQPENCSFIQSAEQFTILHSTNKRPSSSESLGLAQKTTFCTLQNLTSFSHLVQETAPKGRLPICHKGT